jgi:hypothetical protein
MPLKEGGPRGPSYSQEMANGSTREGSKRPTLEPPPDLRSKLLVEGTFKDKEMDIDSGKEPTPASASRPWLPGKCIPQAPHALKYIVSSPPIEEQKQYMRDYSLVGKFLGLWPSEWDLVKWIQHWWKPKGHYEMQMGSKGFFTIILHNLEDRNHIFDGRS